MSTDVHFGRLVGNLRCLGVNRAIPLRVRVAIRRREHLRLWLPLFAVRAALSIAFIVSMVALVIDTGPEPGAINNPGPPGSLSHPGPDPGTMNNGGPPGPPGPGPGAINDPGRSQEYLRSLWISYGDAATAVVAFGAICGGVSILSALRECLSPPYGWWVRVEWLRAARRYALVMEIAQAISACAAAYAAGGEQQGPALRRPPGASGPSLGDYGPPTDTAALFLGCRTAARRSGHTSVRSSQSCAMRRHGWTASHSKRSENWGTCS